ncbi:hypothetical protein [Methylorubrum zatmanii]|uniref:Uncharacterized protein n=1 Tax=Methylorubrum zatmanii TaxID=29429 RepID=A0ABW1WPB2_9HYPH|nr:hypothetical protein [Methylorubrum zatmanii]MBD8909379.1 hypothetical protein [Methylorubrum zatmanii]
MKGFIVARPESEPARFVSSFDPVLAGVAQGLARLFPPVRTIRPQHESDTGGHPATRRGDESGGEEERA